MTAFEKKNSASDNTTDTGETEINGKQNDTATLQNTVFNDTDITNSSNSQENAEKPAGSGEYSLKDDERRPTFYSNAERAVENVKQEKATAEQWKAMLTKAGGIKAGEDKWMGLSAKKEKTGNQTQGTGTDALTPLQSPVSGYKIKDLIHSTQEEDLKILGINREDAQYSLKEDFGHDREYAESVAKMLAELSRKKSAPEIAVPGEDTPFKATVISDADGAKIVQNLETLAKESENISTAKERRWRKVYKPFLIMARKKEKSPESSVVHGTEADTPTGARIPDTNAISGAQSIGQSNS